MKGKVNRTFSPFQQSGESDRDYESWFDFTGRAWKGLSWSELIEKRLVVIVGEAGVGKTYEFKNEVEILLGEGIAAFFLPLNQLDSLESFQRALIEGIDRYSIWIKSDAKGYFFLDAIDEARLTNSASFEKALMVIRQALLPHLKRVSFYVSSRITDWNVVGVREAVRQHLFNPLIDAEDVANSKSETLVEMMKKTESLSFQLEVYKLNPLSAEDARRVAEEFGVKDVPAFWREVEEGGYEFLATRPLDLQWLAIRLNETKGLGGYSDLLETAVRQRLTEMNQSYVASQAVLSQAQLREGAEQLAAACVFSGRAYIQVGGGEASSGNILPADALSNWNPLEHLRLIGSAVFDEATYGRVKFHHRSVTEYLAACWVEKQITAGLPVRRAMSLFVQAPYGKPVLLKSRRPVLCWLAVLNARVRQHIILHFPEMLMFEGDPQRWSAEDVVEAFERYIKKIEGGYRRDWFNDTSELVRVARMLPTELLSEYLNRYSKNPEIFTELLALVKYGRIVACAEIVFSGYRDSACSDRERIYALEVLSAISSPAHRRALAKDMLSGALKSNELIAAGLGVVGIQNMSAEELAKIFSNAGPEAEFGAGPMARGLKYDLLPSLGFDEVLTLLAGLLTALPTLDIGQLTRRAGGGKPPEGWILTVVPDVLLRALQLMNHAKSETLSILGQASLVVEKLRHSAYANSEDFGQLRTEIEKHPALRKQLAIGLSKDIPHAVLSLTRVSGLIQLSQADLEWLIQESLAEGIDAREKKLWYEIAREIAFFYLRGAKRQKVLGELANGADSALRTRDIACRKKQRIEHLREERNWKRQDRAREKEESRQLEARKLKILNDMHGIKSGVSFNAIRDLIIYAAEHDSLSKYTKVNTFPIYRDFGQDLGDAFSEGLKKAWLQIDIPNPGNYLNNQVPWTGLVGLASVNHSFASGIEISSLTCDLVARAVQLSVWGLEKPEPWLDRLAETFPDQVVEALMPWIEFELALPNETPILHTVELMLNAPPVLKKCLMERVLCLLRKEKVFREPLRRRLLGKIADTGLASKEVIYEIVSKHLLAFGSADPPRFASEWFAIWAGCDLPAALRWFEEAPCFSKTGGKTSAVCVAEALEGTSWAKGLSGRLEETTALTALFQFLSSQLSQPAEESLERSIKPSSMQVVRDSIPEILANLKGAYAQNALQTLAVENVGTPIGFRLLNRALEHASAEAEQRGVISPAELGRFGEVYTTEPGTEGRLFEQVVARLEEIREGVEGGPFSDRVLFFAKMEEKQLQIWLAARLDDTPRRRFIPRFVVTREPQVDDDKRTDIEVSCAAGKVCIEVKPLATSRGYSANSLVTTLRDQLVEKYLRARNSRHGVLVLFRLDNRKWEIPGGPNEGNFGDLLTYLQEQARQIKAENEKVERLEVIGINCV